jgi:hypothetical protein
MDPDEPEPTPSDKGDVSERALTLQIGRELAAHYQLLQLAVDLAPTGCALAAAAPFFLALAERSRTQAGALVDAALGRGAAVRLPALARPCVNLAGDGPTLAAALEAAVQLLDASDRRGFAEAAARDPELRRLAEDALLDHARVRARLLRHLAVAGALREDASVAYAAQLAA